MSKQDTDLKEKEEKVLTWLEDMVSFIQKHAGGKRSAEELKNIYRANNPKP